MRATLQVATQTSAKRKSQKPRQQHTMHVVPLADIQKSIEALSARIDEVATPPEGGETIRKSESEPSVVVPSTEDLARMSWEEVHNSGSKRHSGVHRE